MRLNLNNCTDRQKHEETAAGKITGSRFMRREKLQRINTQRKIEKREIERQREKEGEGEKEKGRERENNLLKKGNKTSRKRIKIDCSCIFIIEKTKKFKSKF